MFLFEFSEGDYPFNSGINITTIKKIEWKNIKFINGWETPMDKEREEDCYEVKITFMDGSTDLFLLCEERDTNYFFRQLNKLGLEF